MRKRFAIAIVLALAFTGVSKAEQWNIDGPHSSIGFSVRHMVVSKTLGKFNDFTGAIDFDGKNFDKGSVQMTVQIGSVDTDDEKRDGHLKGADFFDAEKFPTMTFKSKKVTKIGDNEFKLVGDLTIKGVTKEVTFDCEFNGVVIDPRGNTRTGFSAETKINRQDFNVKWSKKLDAGGLVVGDEVKITLEIEAVKSKS